MDNNDPFGFSKPGAGLPKPALTDIIHRLEERYTVLKGLLEKKGAQAHTVEYAILATEAMTIMECIAMLRDLPARGTCEDDTE